MFPDGDSVASQECSLHRSGISVHALVDGALLRFAYGSAAQRPINLPSSSDLSPQRSRSPWSSGQTRAHTPARISKPSDGVGRYATGHRDNRRAARPVAFRVVPCRCAAPRTSASGLVPQKWRADLDQAVCLSSAAGLLKSNDADSDDPSRETMRVASG